MLTLKEVNYRCAQCGHTQTITYFLDDTPLPFTCCVNCRAGFNKDVADMLQRKLGMFPVSEPVIVQHEPDFDTVQAEA